MEAKPHTALQNACEQVKRCESCQYHGRNANLPAQALQTIPLSRPFAVLRLDIVGPFPKSPGGFKFLRLAVDKSTKWIKLEPVREIIATTAIKVHVSAGWESHAGRLEWPAIRA